MKILIAAIICLAGMASNLAAKLDLRFEEQSVWTNDRANWTGALARWEWESFRVVNALVAKAENEEIRRVLPDGEGVLNVVLNYGWRSGRFEGMAQLTLIDEPRNARLVINLGQGESEKHRIALQTGDAEPRVLGDIERAAIDAGYTAGGLVDQYALHVRLDGQKLLVRRSDVEAPAANIDLPADFTPTHLALRSLTGPELFSIQRLRVFRAERDPVVEVQPLHLPFGAMFVEQTPIDLKISGRWYTPERRAYSMRLEVARQLPSESEPITIEREGELSPIEPMRVDVPELGTMPPGLYRVTGTLRIDQSEREITARFAVLSSELAARPREQIPHWVGMMPFLNLLPQDRYAPGFALMDLMGVRHVRFLPGWGRIEPFEGQYDWREADHFVDLCEKHGITAMFCLSYYGPAWTVAKSKGQRAYTPEGRALWVERFAVPTIARYGDRVKEYQIWNEPDAFWDDDPAKARGFAAHFGTPANYFDLVKRTHAAAHALGIDGIKVMASLSSGNQVHNIRRLFD
ncbi:MAG TPA: beta-galactosidase, partial [Tepidisphaeraceae bacterium]|nr:beta-galactosidase [Tepidisphaeraceae bacterium]